MALALWGVLDVIVQAVLVGPIVKRTGDRRAMVIGLYFGAFGLAGMALAPDGWSFVAAIVLSSVWGLSQPTILALQTRRVSEREHGQLQGANMSVAAFAGIIAPIFFGAVYAVTVGKEATVDAPGASFGVAAAVLLAAALLGAIVARRADAADALTDA
jgi:DHA1 family tetracycline resistance protein-like MFS transporter